jgi:hypothetical protein
MARGERGSRRGVQDNVEPKVPLIVPSVVCRVLTICRRDSRMRTFVRRLKQLWDTPVEFYGVDRPEPQAGPWHGLMLFVILLMVLGLLWLIRYLPERTYLVQDWPDVVRGAHMATTDYSAIRCRIIT